MDLRALRFFAHVAETESVSRSAKALHRSQPSVSRTIQELESELGVALFLREGRRITLAPEGWSLLREVRRLLADADAVADHARRLAGGKTLVLRVGGAANTIERVLPGLIVGYRSECPNVEVSIVSDSGTALISLLERGELDIALTRYTESDTLQSLALYPTHIVAVLHREHPLARRRSIDVDALSGESLLMPPAPFTSRTLFDAACRERGLRPRVALESDDLNALVALANVGYGVAVVPSSVALDRRSVAVRLIGAGDRMLSASTAAVWDRRRAPAHLRAFVNLAEDRLRHEYPGKFLAPSAARSGLSRLRPASQQVRETSAAGVRGTPPAR